ncbi:DUF257 family protein [Thermococcus sp.]
MKFSEYIGGVKAGENVLIEHTSLSAYPVLFYLIGKTYGWGRLIMVDVIDSSLPILRWARHAGVELPSGLARIKAGGTSEWGRIILELDPHRDPGIFLTKFEGFIKGYYEEHSGEEMVTVIMNSERLVPIQNNRRGFILILTNFATSFIGNPGRRLFFFVNIDLADGRYVALLEEAFTRVIRIDDKVPRVLKSPNSGEEGKELKLK